MDCTDCPCGGCHREDVETAKHTLARREALLAGASALMLAALGGLRGGIPAALAARVTNKTKRKAFHAPAGSRKVGNINHLGVGKGLAVVDPKTGGPAVVIRLSKAKQVKAFSAVCTHAGCTVGYSSARRLLICPCHGSVYDPAHKAAVLAGPAPYPLPSLKTAIDPSGNIWLV